MTRTTLARLTAGILTGLLAVPALAQSTGSDGGKVAVFRLSGAIKEKPAEFEFNFDLEPQRTLYDLLQRLNRAKHDPNLKAVVFTFDDPAIGWGQMQELRSAIKNLRAADKEVYCFLEDADAGSYMLGSSASKVIMVPTGNLLLTGIHVEHPYFKGLMDKIGVQADIVHVGAYKSAGEPFTRTGPSEEAQQMNEWLINDLYEQMVEMIADGRQKTPEEVRALIDQGPFTAEEAKAAGLVDELAYAEDLSATLRKRHGQNIEFSHNYGSEKKTPEVDFTNIFSLFKSFGEMMSKGETTATASIAVVYVDGMITTGTSEQSLFSDGGTVGSTTIRRTLQEIKNDSNIKAVVIRVDSPGGSATASDIMWKAARDVAKEKPLVVSQGNVAASGGYYVSVGASTIFAEPATLTGSIGVIGGKIITKGLWDWAGINFHSIEKGKNAGLFSTSQQFTPEQRAEMEQLLKDIYGSFTDRVKKGRGDRLKKDMEELAGGRVYTGRQAMKLGLVDKLGGLQDAIKFAADEANISNYEVVQYPKSKNFLELFMEGLTGERKDKKGDIDIEMGGPKLGSLLGSPLIRSFLPGLEAMDPIGARVVLRSLMRIQMLQQERVLCVTPTEMLIR